MNTKQVIVVRKDLNMRKGKIAAQVAHASMGALLSAMKRTEAGDYVVRNLDMHKDEPMAQWLDGQFTKVVVYVNSEKELLDLSLQCIQAIVGQPRHHYLIKDSGKTEFNGVPTYTCLAVGPDDAENVDRITGHLPLL